MSMPVPAGSALLNALNTLPAFGETDLLRRVQHEGLCAQPVFSFGDPRAAKVATVSLNPSFREFQTRTQEILPLESRRFENPWLSKAPLGISDVNRIQGECNEYFKRKDLRGKSTVFRTWFASMERLLNRANLSYYKGTACHLDLSPWPSYPVWRELRPHERDEHLRLGIPVLLHQLGVDLHLHQRTRASSIGKILLNGVTARDAVLSALGGAQRATTTELELRSASGAKRMLYVTVGEVRGIDFVAWNLVLARPFGSLAMAQISQYI